MSPDLHVLAPHGIGGRTTLGYHPRDGRPVACWVVHPTRREAGSAPRLERYAAALGLGECADEELALVDDYRASLTAGGGWATLWVGDEAELVAAHDEAWLDALLDRGWAVVVVGYSTELATWDNPEIMAYLAGGGSAHVGVVRTA